MPAPAAVPPCRRCGRCCRLGGPALHHDDLPAIRDGRIRPEHCLTLRRGETVTDNVAGGVGPLPVELVKLRPVPGGRACLFYHDPPACAIHDTRPVECRTLSCDAPATLAALYATNRLTRADILPPGSDLAELCAHHEAETDLARLTRLCRQAAAGDEAAREAARAVARLDAALRELLPRRLGLAPQTLLFYLGRPLVESLPALRAALTIPGGLYKRRP
ncbi:YkgJ family cysteine cluster protein [Solidesulfovibrio sp.]